MDLPSTLLPVIVNRSGGTARRAGDALAARIEAAFSAAGQAIALELVDGGEVSEAIRRHRAAPRVVVGGGDGTIATGAQLLAERGGELAILPLGTRNHFARQLGVPLELEAAAVLAMSGRAERVDLAEAGNRVFINNASAGAYVDLVQEREATRLPGVLALGYGAVLALMRLRSRRFTLAIDGERQTIATPLLLFGNNRYEVREGNPIERTSLTDGFLSCYAVAPLSRTALIAAALRILVGKPRMHSDFVLDRMAREAIIEGSGELAITLDGERCHLPLPLTLRIRPCALAVVPGPEPHG
jgi:diacylglycerol kinase family enzyme